MRFVFKRNLLIKPVLFPFGATGSTSYAELGQDGLEVRFGALFHHTFPYSALASVQRDEWPWWNGLGVRLGWGGKIGVIACTKNVVSIRFSEAISVPLFFGLTKETRQLYLALEEPELFLKELRKILETRQAGQ